MTPSELRDLEAFDMVHRDRPIEGGSDAEVERLRNLCRHILQADTMSSDVVKPGFDAGDRNYLCWWAYDLVKAAAEGCSLAGTFADKPPVDGPPVDGKLRGGAK